MRRLLLMAAVVCAAGLLLLLTSVTGLLERLELLSRDARQVSGLGQKVAEPEVAVAWIDQESIDYMRREGGVSFPWPRSIYADVVRFLRNAGAKAIVFDLLFGEPMNAEDDRLLAEAIAEPGAPVILSYIMVGWRKGGFDEDETKRFEARGRSQVDGPDAPGRLDGVILPIPELDAATPHAGFFNVDGDIDGVVRRMELVRRWGEKLYPSLALATVEALTGQVARFENGVLHLGERRAAVDAQGRLALRFRGGAFAFEHVKLVNILVSVTQLAEGQEPLYAPERFRDRIVILGANAEGYEDARKTPVAVRFPGPELHATAIANLLAPDPLLEAGWVVPSGALGLALGSAIPFSIAAVGLGALALLGALGLWTAIACFAFAQGIVLPIATPALGVLLAAGLAYAYRLIVEGKQKRELRRAFSSYMAPEVVAQVLKSPGGLRLGGEEREISVFFSDLAGFTGLSEATTPQELVAFLNSYFTRMGDHVMRESGIIDKFIGDAIMALFGAPLARKDHALSAIAAALACKRELALVNEELARAGKPAVSARIGLHSGIAVVGNMGSQRRFDYTAMGDTVNLASRLEGANKPFGTAIMASEVTWKAVGGAFQGREIGKLRVVGRGAAMTVWEPLAAAGAELPFPAEFLAVYEEALGALRARGPEASRALFERARALQPGDKLVQAYLKAVADPSWDGIFALDSK
ncbi:MAG: adenylate/guanylate cyclase domain-containing protein [Planctomycetes bacterium]|nr:adenylate/guanylate cyclase domain-containing protein [Planctomycetota bacterium]